MTREEIEKTAQEGWNLIPQGPLVEFAIQQVNAALEEAACLMHGTNSFAHGAAIRALKIP